jgi:protein-S-isoprenylcysteine O-methyltransferase Ste14
MPRMTVNLLAFNLVTTAYLLAGSLHEEHRLRATYGEAYLDYQRRVPFFPIPAERRLLEE